MTNLTSPLPPGQRERADFPRFGLGKFANRFPVDPGRTSIALRGDVGQAVEVDSLGDRLARCDQISDFHCVTTWSVRELRWSGFRFADFHFQVALPLACPDDDARWVVFRGADGYRSILPLQDLLADDVLLADRLNGEALGLDHGAPFRLVAPAHYGYKNVKHVETIEYWRDRRNYRFPFPYPGLMDHPRGRVAEEERAQFVPAWLLRPLYRLMVPSAAWRFAAALRRRQRNARADG